MFFVFYLFLTSLDEVSYCDISYSNSFLANVQAAKHFGLIIADNMEQVQLIFDFVFQGCGDTSSGFASRNSDLVSKSTKDSCI